MQHQAKRSAYPAKYLAWQTLAGISNWQAKGKEDQPASSIKGDITRWPVWRAAKSRFQSGPSQAWRNLRHYYEGEAICRDSIRTPRGWRSLVNGRQPSRGFYGPDFPAFPSESKDRWLAAWLAPGAFSDAFGLGKLNMGTFIGFYRWMWSVLGLGGALCHSGQQFLAKEEQAGTAEFLLTHHVGLLSPAKPLGPGQPASYSQRGDPGSCSLKSNLDCACAWPGRLLLLLLCLPDLAPRVHRSVTVCRPCPANVAALAWAPSVWYLAST